MAARFRFCPTLTGTGKAISVNAPLVLAPLNATSAGSYTFANNNTSATNTLNFGGAISGGTTTNTVTLTLNGTNTGINTVTGNISNGSATTFGLSQKHQRHVAPLRQQHV
jgi:carbon monoxide dehydrogenase subunit G